MKLVFRYWLACSIVAMMCAPYNAFSAPRDDGNTSSPLEILRASQARYLASEDFVLSGTIRTYTGPPLEFFGNQSWLLSARRPNKISYSQIRSDGGLTGKILYDGTYYLEGGDGEYAVRGTGLPIADMYKFIQDAKEPVLDFADSEVSAFTLQSDYLTTDNPCLSTIQMGVVEEIEGRLCYAISIGPCIAEEGQSTYYLTTDTLDLRRLIVTTHLAEVEETEISVDNSAVSDSYYVSVFDVETQRLGSGSSTDVMLSPANFKPNKTYEGYEDIRLYETFDEIPDSVKVNDADSNEHDAEKKTHLNQDSVALAISLPSQTTVSLKSLATFDHEIQAITVRSYNGESSIFVALQNDKVHEIDASGLQLNSFKLRADDINFPIGGASPIMYVSLYDKENDRYSLSSYDTSKTNPTPVVLTADAAHSMLMADEQTSETWAVFIDDEMDSLFLLNGIDGKAKTRRAKVSDYVVPRYSNGKLAGYLYYAQGWTAAVEIDLNFKWVRNRTLPYYTVDIESKPGMGDGEYLVQLANDKVGILTNEDTFDEFRSRAWGYGIDEWLPEYARAGKGTAAVPGFVYHVASYAGLTVFDRAGRVVLQSKLVSGEGKEGFVEPDLMMFCDVDQNGTLELLMVIGRRLYHLDYSPQIGRQK